MRKFWWSTMFLLVGAALAFNLTSSYFTHKYLGGQPRVHVRGTPKAAESQVEPLVIMPQAPPRFYIDTVEPIVVQSAPEETAPSVADDNVTPAPTQAAVPTRMPYADEAEIVENQVDTAFWEALVDVLQNLLPTAAATVEPAAAEEAQENSQPENFPTAEEPTPDQLHMPMVPAEHDYHHSYPHCPYLGGSRSYPTFGEPAYQFNRPTPAPASGSNGFGSTSR